MKSESEASKLFEYYTPCMYRFRVYGWGLKSLELGIGLRKKSNKCNGAACSLYMHKPYIHRNLNSKPSTVSLLQHEKLCTTFRSLVALQ